MTSRGVMGSQVAVNRLFVQHFVQANKKETIKAQHYCAFVRGIHRYPGDFLTKDQYLWCFIPFTSLQLIWRWHYSDVIMRAIASEITGVTSVYAIICSGADQRKHQSSASLPVTGEFPAQRARDPENVSIWWRHHGVQCIRRWNLL